MSVRFDAATDRITYSASSPPDPASGFTVTAWAMVRVDTNVEATIFRAHVVAGDSTSATAATSNDGTGGPNYFTAGGSVTATTGFVVDSWRKVAWSRSGSTGHVYIATVGGATEHVSGTVGGAANPTGMTLGGRSAADGSEAFDGRLAYVRVWSTALSQAQIETEWASAAPVVTSGLWADWPLTVHTDLTDHSGNGRDLVAGATSTTTEADPPLAESGTLTVTLPALAASLTGTANSTGAFSATLPALTAALAGAASSTGVLTVTLPAMAGGISGARDIDFTATLAAQDPALAVLGARRWSASLEAQ